MIPPEMLTPLAPFILIKRKPATEKYGHLKIILPGTQMWDNRECEVINTHRGRTYFTSEGEEVVHEATVKKGEIVLSFPYDDTKLGEPYNGDGYALINEDEILAVVGEGTQTSYYNIPRVTI